VIVGRNDGSAEVVDLQGKTGMVGPKPLASGLDMFTQATPGQVQNILNPQIIGGAQGGGGMDPNQGLGGQLPGQLPGALPGQLPGALPGQLPGALPGQVPGALPGQLPGALPAPGAAPSPLNN